MTMSAIRTSKLMLRVLDVLSLKPDEVCWVYLKPEGMCASSIGCILEDWDVYSDTTGKYRRCCESLVRRGFLIKTYGKENGRQKHGCVVVYYRRKDYPYSPSQVIAMQRELIRSGNMPAGVNLV